MLAVLLTVAIVSVFVVRLVDIQIVRADELNTASLNKRAIAQPIYAARGDIVDTHGVVLADSVIRYDVTASPKNANGFDRIGKDNKKESVSVFQAITEIAAITKQDASKMCSRSPGTAPPTSPTSQRESPPQLSARCATSTSRPGLPQNRPTRTYPNGAVAGNIVADRRHGRPQNGIEITEDKCLEGHGRICHVPARCGRRTPSPAALWCRRRRRTAER